MVEYLSDLNEKWMVRKVSFCSFGPVWSRFGKSSISFSFSKYSDPGNFVEIQEIFENSEIGVRETLFSEDFIWSNICRIYMKSWLWERSNPVLFDLFYSLFVGPFAPDQWLKKNNIFTRLQILWKHVRKFTDFHMFRWSMQNSHPMDLRSFALQKTIPFKFWMRKQGRNSMFLKVILEKSWVCMSLGRRWGVDLWLSSTWGWKCKLLSRWIQDRHHT